VGCIDRISHTYKLFFFSLISEITTPENYMELLGPSTDLTSDSKSFANSRSETSFGITEIETFGVVPRA
jgi:hypothetical protein